MLFGAYTPYGTACHSAVLLQAHGVTVPVSGGLQRVLAPTSVWALICACNNGTLPRIMTGMWMLRYRTGTRSGAQPIMPARGEIYIKAS